MRLANLARCHGQWLAMIGAGFLFVQACGGSGQASSGKDAGSSTGEPSAADASSGSSGSGSGNLATSGDGSSQSGEGGSSASSSGSPNMSGTDSASGSGAMAPGALVWVDATGTVVPFLLQFGFGGSAWTDEAGGLFVDTNGIMWAFGPVSCGGPTNICPAFSQDDNNYPYGTYWDGLNCTGTAYVPYVHAGMAFTLAGPSGNTVRALNANAAVAMQFLQSSYGVPGSASGCQSGTTVQILAAPLSDAPIVTLPTALPFMLPIHPEMLP